MDHLPHPGRERKTPLRVPFLLPPDATPPNYNEPSDFISFPEGHAYVPGGEYFDRTATDIASFAQSFLYFGLLSAVLGQPVEPNIFFERRTLEDGTLEETLSSSKLKDLIVDYQMLPRKKEMPSAHQNQLKEQIENSRVRTILSYALHQLSKLERIRHPTTHPLPVVLLSIGVLIETLTWCLIPDLNMRTPVPHMRGEPDRPASATLLLDIMKGNEWCPSQGDHILYEYSYCLSYYLSQIRRPHRERGHKGCKVCELNECEDGLCYALNKPEKEEYHMSHVGNCTGCDEIVVTDTKLRVIIENNQIPVFSIKQDSNGKVRLEAKELRPNDKYVAISHVWSDGMGNENRNGVLECQLKRISKYLTEVPGLTTKTIATRLPTLILQGKNLFQQPTLFWLDTLCISVDPELKSKSMNTIPGVYAGASQVLVLDSEMEQTGLSGSDWPEMAGRLVFSAWAGRSWTLEEASFSQLWNVRVADGWFDPMAGMEDGDLFLMLLTSPLLGKRLWEALAQRSWTALRGLLSRNDRRKLSHRFDSNLIKAISQPLKDFFSEMSSYWARDEFNNQVAFVTNQFVSTWNCLGRRQTKVEEDKFTIFTHLLDLNPFEVFGSITARGLKPLKSAASSTELEPLLTNQRPSFPQRSPSTLLELEKAMKKVLRRMDALPLDLLYNNRDRARPDENHDCRWVPLYPSRERIEEYKTMRWNKDGLVLEGAGPDQPDEKKMDKLEEKVYLFTPGSLYFTASEFIFKDYQPNGGYKRVKARFLQSKNDKMVRKNFIGSLLVFEEEASRGNEFRGACLQISKIDYAPSCSCPSHRGDFAIIKKHSRNCEDSSVRIECVYDCPVRIQQCEGEGESADISLIRSKRISGMWTVTLSCSKYIQIPEYLLHTWSTILTK